MLDIFHPVYDKNGKRRWTSPEDQYLREHVRSLSVQQLAEDIGRSEAAIIGRINFMNIRRKPHIKDCAAEIKEMYMAGMRTSDIAAAIGMSDCSVSKYITKNLKNG